KGGPLRRSRGVVLAVLLAAVCSASSPGLAQTSDVAEIETAARSFFAAYRSDPSTTGRFLQPNARWIAGGSPAPAQGASAWREEADKAGARITNYTLRDVVTQARGEVAWVTATLDGTWVFSDSDAGGRLMDQGAPGQHEWRLTFVESLVL